MSMEALKLGLIELGRELHPEPLILAGGYGLYLRHLQRSTWRNTLIPPETWTNARATADLDVLLQPEVVVDSQAMARIRSTLERLGYEVIPTAACMQWRHPVTRVKIDLLAGPLGEFESRARRTDNRRVGPRPSVNLHAHDTPEALDYHVRPEPLEVTLDGAGCTVYVPRPITLLLMKLFALRDQTRNASLARDAAREHGRHHALDLYRIFAMMTEPEYDECRQSIREWDDSPVIRAARLIRLELFGDPFAPPEASGRIGLLRLRENDFFREQGTAAIPSLRLFQRALGEVLPPQDEA
jgi:hypothetical protein